MAETKQILGQLPINREYYSDEKEYYKDNIVQFENGSYYCKVKGPIKGINPDNEDTWGLWSGFPLSSNYEDNEEFIRVILDNEGKVLAGIRKDGSVTWSKGVPAPITEYVRTIEEALKENLQSTSTNVQTSIDGLNQKITNVENIHKDIVETFKYIEDNPEFISLITDADGYIVFGIRTDGSIYIPKGSSEDTKKALESLNEVSKEIYSDVEDRLELLLDSDGKILSYRKTDGTLVEKNLEVESLDVKNLDVDTAEVDTLNINDALNLSSDAAEQLYDDLRKSGFGSVKTDWSEATSLYIDTPRRAVVNISGIDAMPTTKTEDLHAWLEFWDMQGNYFKKRTILNAQGSSSMTFIKKNFAIDLCNDEWEGDDTFSLQIGSWVPQDSFHCKAYYTEFLKGTGIIAYQIADEVEKLRGPLADRAWKRAKLDKNVTGSATFNKQISNISLNLDNGARCMPDGFPIWCYLNGEFYGIFSWQIKKHRDNYHMNKKNYKEIHLDGVITPATLFRADGNASKINFNPSSGFEVRNPKSLICVDGSKYDADKNARQELIGEDDSSYDAGNKDMKNTAITKKAIVLLSTYILQLRTLKNNNASSEEIRELYETFFDVESVIDYTITNAITRDTDGYGKNWQWVTYDGVKWSVCEYDKDMSFGNHHTGRFTTQPPTEGSFLGNLLDTPIGWVIVYYKKELKEKWNEVVNAGIASVDNIASKIKTWMDRVSPEGYAKEYKRWPESPCYRNNGVGSGWVILPIQIGAWSSTSSYAKDAYVYNSGKVYKSLVSSNKSALSDSASWEDITYSSTQNYSKGVIVGYFLTKDALILEATTAIQGVEPFNKEYTNVPYVGGYYDSYWRFIKYVEQTLNVMNDYIKNL